MVRAFLSGPSGVLGLAILALFAVISIVAPQFLAAQARAYDVFSAAQQPSPAHLLGTDGLGRDILLRLLVATPLSLGLAIAATLLASIVGIPLGTVAAVLPGRWRMAALRTIDALFAFPFILVAIFLTAIIGPSPLGAILGVGIPLSFGKARVTSALVMSIAGRDFVAAARVIGVPRRRLMLRYLLPNIAETLAITTTVSISSAVLAVSSLSFLGLGIQPPDYDWGRMLTEGVNSFYTTPIAAVAPATIIAFSALAFGFVGEALARAFNPTLWTAAQAVRPGRFGFWGPVASATKIAASDNHSHDEPSQESSLSNAEGVLEIQNLSVRFPGRSGPIAVVDNISFSMGRGDFVGIVGESGSGKTMTSLAIAQLVPYPGQVDGTVKLDGTELRRLADAPLRKFLAGSVATVFQDPASSLNPALKIGTQLTEGLEEHGHVTHRQAAAAALNGLTEVNIPMPELQLERYPHELSGGMRQRVMIAMGLINQPDLLIADEPTTALDVTIQAQIMDLLAQINQRHQTAIILISHNIGLISQNCDRALVMYAGRIVEDLSIEQMQRNPLHPYTRALIGSVPNMGGKRGAPLESIPGQPADIANLAPGCPYHPRCQLAIDRCSVERPPLVAGPERRRVACWVANESRE